MWIVDGVVNYADNTDSTLEPQGPWTIEQVNAYIKLQLESVKASKPAVTDITFTLINQD